MMKRSLASFLGLLIVALVAIAQTPSAPANLVIMASQGGGTSGGGGSPPEASSACDDGDTTDDLYVRDGGTGNGSAWDNALDNISGDPVRGKDYYFADGSYGSVTWDTATSGTTLINFCKASVADHGTSQGWQDTYGDGAATFGSVTLDLDYAVFDGAYRNELDWGDQGSYGFRVTSSIHTYTDASVRCGDHLTVKYTDAGGAYGTSYTGSEPEDAFKVSCFTGLSTDITLQRNWFHNSASFAMLHLNGLDGYLIEENYISEGWGKEAIRGQIALKNGIIRRNLLKNACGSTGLPGEGCTSDIALFDGSSGGFDNNEVYGNIFWCDSCDGTSQGTVIAIGGQEFTPFASGSRVFNNTIVGSPVTITNGSSIRIDAGGSDNICNNNLYYDTIGTPSTTCGTASNNGEAATDPFVNYATGDFHLSAGIAGTSSNSPAGNATDFDGVTRGGDGTWDRGAYEFE